MDTRIHNEWSVSNSTFDASSQGKVYLIGAGPGDPDLITVKALRCLQAADVVLYDRLVNLQLLDEMRPGATRVFVGKGPTHHPLEQPMISELLIAYARQNCMVVRLKGGDPFIFGRGGEEAEALVEAGVPFEIVPGVSSAVAVPAYAGIPVTHRDYASAVTIITGHEGQKEASQQINWEALANLGGTLVVLMGVRSLPRFTKRLIAGGLDPELPAAVIQEGTTQQQRVVTGTLSDIAQLALDAGLSSPATTVIGKVVNLRETLHWYEQVQQKQHVLAQALACL